jgi:ribonuclease R
MSKNIPTGEKNARIPAKDLRRLLKRHFEQNPGKIFVASNLIKQYNLKNNRESVEDALFKLSSKGWIEKTRNGGYKASLRMRAKSQRSNPTFEGTVDKTRSGDAYIICEGLEDDVYVPRKRLRTALNGDRVRVELTRIKRSGKQEGAVVEVIQRSREEVLAHIFSIKKTVVAFPIEDEEMGEIRIDHDDLNGAKEGDLIVASITRWPDRFGQPLRARVRKVVTDFKSSDLESLQILFSNGFTPFFPTEVEKEMEKVSGEITKDVDRGRRDFRNIPTFTIDPADAKDFDDALSFRYLDDGNREISIHIADVSHFVRPGSETDKEAFRRSTSVYLVGKVAPMLPEKLSNDLCSLKPDIDRLSFSAVFVFDKDNRIINRWFGKGIIHSQKRFTYEDAQAILDGAEGPLKNELMQINRVARYLRKKRFKQGSINFETQEVVFDLDEMGNPMSIRAKTHGESNQLVEEMMLLANREVASFINKAEKGKPVPFVYRIHDEPNREKLADFALLAREMGFPFDLQSPSNIAKSFNKLMQQAREREELRLLEPLAIRTMSKAEYSTDNIGHYGLGFEYYTHFTSPIRRYSDVLVHRILEVELEGGDSRSLVKDLESQCKHISQRERAAMECERESIRLKQALYLEDKVGQEFNGTVSGFIEKGFFVELDATMAEGLVTFDQFDEPFILAENGFTAMGKYSGVILQMGTKVVVSLEGVNIERRQIDLGFVSLKAVDEVIG